MECSGIYTINCKTCKKEYVGQTKRTIKTRFKEHMAHFKYNRVEKSRVAQHIYETGHKITIEDLKIRKKIGNSLELNSHESILIHKKAGNLLNGDKGPIPDSVLYELL